MIYPETGKDHPFLTSQKPSSVTSFNINHCVKEKKKIELKRMSEWMREKDGLYQSQDIL